VVAAAQSGALLNVETKHLDALNLDFPVSIPGVASEYIDPQASWGNDAAYDAQATKLASLFRDNIEKFDVSDDIISAGPAG
jgi:phosphoenolpyruvate carboxykinase (ATP)